MQRFLGLEHLSLRKMASGGSLEEPFLSRHQPRTSVYHHLQIFTNVLGFWSGRLLCALKRWQVTIGYHRLPQVTTLHRSCKISQWASGSPQGPHRVPTHIAPDIRHFDQAWPPELQAWPIMEDLNHSTGEFANKNGDLDRKTSRVEPEVVEFARQKGDLTNQSDGSSIFPAKKHIPWSHHSSFSKEMKADCLNGQSLAKSGTPSYSCHAGRPRSFVSDHCLSVGR